MFPYADAESLLALQRERSHELRREAAADRLARSVRSAGRHRRSGRADRAPARR